ncbi:MAG: hypothetical protein SFV21_07290 [Rhodospirillaceae bacterium]|nr:hypothetical protein [Rhodospirillaceae bacterium]
MPLKTVRAELARTKDHPQGDPGHVYEFRAPLDAAGQFDADGWAANKQLCVVRRLQNGVEQEKGLLVRTTAGRWVFSYQPGDEDDEALFRFSTHTFKPGEYFSLTEHDGVQRAFRVVSVTDWHPAK